MGISKHDKQALTELITAMGVPLVVALQTVESWSGEVMPLPQKAEKLAKLLNITVDFATKVTKKLEIRDAYTLESVRGKIIRIVTPIVAETYIANGETPKEESLKDLTDLFDVLLSFADSVSPEDSKEAKPHNVAVMIEAFEPVLSAVKNHAFGLPQETVFAKITEGIHGRAESVSEQLNAGDAVQNGMLKAVAKLYVSCHSAFTAKIEAGQTNEDGEAALKSVWQDCDERMALIQGLTGFVGTNIGMAPTPAKAKKAEPVAAEAPVSPKPAKDDKLEVKPTPEKQSDNNDDDEDDGDFNPMAFFAGGKG